jgi:hypothetical protein
MQSKVCTNTMNLRPSRVMCRCILQQGNAANYTREEIRAESDNVKVIAISEIITCLSTFMLLSARAVIQTPIAVVCHVLTEINVLLVK